ncbi:MAG: LCP family protein [Acidimicrobiales bacterium]
MSARRPAVIGVAAGAIVLLVVAVMALVWPNEMSQGPFSARSEAAIQVSKVDEAHFAPVPDRPIFVAILGHDARPGEAVSRADALHLVGINPGTGQATVLNVPRDTYVDIPGGGRDKINAAYARGGPVLQAQALGQLVGVQVSFVISTSFGGLVDMVDQLGGVDVDVPVPMNDVFSRAVFPRGRVHMNGTQVLAFSRNRHVNGGDFARTQHQGLVIQSALAKLRAEGTSPPNLFRWLAVLSRHSRFDGISVPEIYRLGRLAASVDPNRLNNVTMPGYAGYAGAASVVFPAPAAAGLFADFRDDAVMGAASR